MGRTGPLPAVKRLKRALCFFFSCLLWQMSVYIQKLLMLLWCDLGSPVTTWGCDKVFELGDFDHHCEGLLLESVLRQVFINVGIWQLYRERWNQSLWSHTAFLPSSAAKWRFVWSLLYGTNPFVTWILDSTVLLCQFVEFARIGPGPAACVWKASVLFVPLVAGPRTKVLSKCSFARVV